MGAWIGQGDCIFGLLSSCSACLLEWGGVRRSTAKPRASWRERIAQQIRNQEADCVLAVKGNQKALPARIQDTFVYVQTQGFVDCPHADVKTVHKDHGRVETRRCGTIGAPDYGRYVDPHQVWADLQSLVMVESALRCREQTTRAVRYYISRLSLRAANLLPAV